MSASFRPLFCFIATTVCTVASQKSVYRRVRKGVTRLFGASISLTDHWELKDGEHKFLEEVLGDDALNWVKLNNEKTLNDLGDPKDDALYPRILSILDSKDKIPYVRKIGDYYYNFWQDEKNPRGIWRRISWQNYISNKDDSWQTILDFDKLGADENESWVYKGHSLCELHSNNIKGKEPHRTLMKISRGGADATVIREYDIKEKRFIPESEGGFVVPEAKSRVSWLTEDSILIGTDFKDENNPLTDSGYPRTVRIWKRGTPLSSAQQVYEGEKSDVACSGYFVEHNGYAIEWRCRSVTFYTSKYSIRLANSDEWYDLDQLPEDVDLSQFQDQIFISLRTNWLSYTAGALLSVDAKELINKGTSANFTCLFEPTETISLLSYTSLKSRLLLHTLDNVQSKISIFKFNREGGWVLEDEEKKAQCRGASLTAIDSDSSDEFWMVTSSFLKPSQMCRVDAAKGLKGIQDATASPIRSLKDQFDNKNLVEEQGEAISKDGTKIPFFIIRNKNMKYDGNNPTLMFGYGGFEIPLLPSYASVVGASWLERGNVYVIANIRGGGEYGPKWHQAALKANRNKAYEDFIAVAETLIEMKVTTQTRLAIRGGSNGGLLMGNMMVQRPDLFGAIVCAVPLLDMRRFSHLLAGSSWQAEYGNPDTEDWDDFLKRYSAYHNIDHVNAARTYPPLLMTTSTRDDRVHPYHARSFVKRLQDVGCSPHYYENMEGGHGGAADSKQQAFMTVLYIKFLSKVIAS